jgi:hypothetical protein
VKTSELIATLSADHSAPDRGFASRAALAFAGGALVSTALFFVAIGPRVDVMSAIRTMRFDMKFVDALALGVPALLLCLRLLRPDARAGALGIWLALPVALLLCAIGAELIMVPPDQWARRLIGSNALHCLTIIPLLSIAPLAALIATMRRGAPMQPRLAGAVAGLASGALAAMLYASNCPDDSPLFVASWYSIAILVVALVGAAAGGRFLRW